MATILRGRRNGDTVTIHQFCNDWITDEEGNVHNPTSLQLDEAEVITVRAAAAAGDTGIMFRLYDLGDDGRFRRLPVTDILRRHPRPRGR